MKVRAEMMGDALRSAEISLIRHAVPEFEPRFQLELREEEGELGSFQAMSVFAEWVLERLDVAPGAPDTFRAFAAVEAIAVSSFPLGRPLAAEFVEAVWSRPGAVLRLGEATRAYLELP